MIATVQTKKITSDFTSEILSFFLREKEANLAPYIYGSPNPNVDNDMVSGSEIYRKLVYDVADYYLYKGEISLIQKYAQQIASYIPEDSTVIEFGPGTKHAFQKKSLPILKFAENKIKKYVAIDLCPDYLYNAEEILNKELTHIPLELLHDDFIKNYKLIQEYKNPVIFFKGSTMTNLSPSECIQFMKNLSGILPPQGIFIVGIDSNQDENVLAAAYDEGTMGELTMDTLYRTHRDCDMDNFNPRMFKYKFKWREHDYCVRHGIEATANQTFTLEGETINVERGEILHVLSSHKYPVEVFHKMANEGGFNALEHFIDENNRMTIHILQK